MTFTVGDNAYPAIVCFGDSQTQFASGPSGYVAQLANAYQRKADIINRGFSGYTTRDVLPLVKYVFASQKQGQKVLATIVWLGCNDSIEPGQKQYVSELDYASNMKEILNSLRGSDPLSSSAPYVLVLGPTPVSKRLHHDNERKTTYTDIARKIARSNGCDFLDTYELFTRHAEPLEKLLDEDGLHISPAGYAVLFEAVLAAIKTGSSGALDPARLPSVFPEWSALGTDKAEVAKQVVPHRQV